MSAAPYDPRSAIDARTDLVLAFDEVAGLMGGGLHTRRGSVGVIVVDPQLEGAERRAVLTHELVHHERGDPVAGVDAPAGLEVLRDREERAVDAEVARRLVPTDLLRALAESADAQWASDGGGISPIEVAEHFDVPIAVAHRALEQLARDYSPPPAG
ncbi:MAG: ImmA/IrrE family metallo-endopeptidase [Acidimicrobiales bacterium]